MKNLWIVLAAALVVSSAREAVADGAVSFILGGNIGGNLNVLTDDGVDVVTSIQNSPLYGVRIGSYGFPFGFEGSLIYSPSALVGGAFDGAIETKANLLYTEANALLILLPGPIAPFATFGAGLHYVSFDVADLLSLSNSKLGWNYGGGIKFNVSRLQLRLDVRDHVTSIGLDDFGLGDVGNIIGLTETSTRVHNVEFSFGVGVRF